MNEAMQRIAGMQLPPIQVRLAMMSKLNLNRFHYLRHLHKMPQQLQSQANCDSASVNPSHSHSQQEAVSQVIQSLKVHWENSNFPVILNLGESQIALNQRGLTAVAEAWLILQQMNQPKN